MVETFDTEHVDDQTSSWLRTQLSPTRLHMRPDEIQTEMLHAWTQVLAKEIQVDEIFLVAAEQVDHDVGIWQRTGLEEVGQSEDP